MIISNNEKFGEIQFDGELILEEDVKRKILQIQELLNSNILGKKERITVALILSRSPLQMIAILAMLAARVTYVPISEMQPDARIKYILFDAEVDFVLVDNSTCNINTFGIKKINIESEQILKKNMKKEYIGNEVAYILYTSGTTGKPKGVEIYRRSLRIFKESICNRLDICQHDIIVSFTNYEFDIFFLETIVFYLCGNRIVIASQREKSSPMKMKGLIVQSKATIMQSTPSMIEYLQLADARFMSLKGIKKLLIGGERLSFSLLNELKNIEDMNIYNLYGPTETTIWVTCGELSNSEDVNVGKPLDDVKIIIVSEQGDVIQSESADQRGEVYISGPLLAKGYKNNPNLTKEKFVLNDNELYYKTGDIGFYNKDGCIVIVGRLDNQIKINGHRVELEEIEQILKNYKEPINASVYYDKERYGLIVFYQGKFNEMQIKRIIKNNLPYFMMPNRVVKIDDLCYTSTGKVDRTRIFEEWKWKGEVNA